MSDDERLDKTVVYEILSSERRRRAIDYLKASENGVEVGDIAEYIAEEETGESPPPKDARKTVYVSLHQTHLPKMDDLDIVNYNTDTNEVTLSDSFRDVAIYMEVVPGTEISWSEYYLAVGIVGLATVFAHISGAPVISSVPVEYWGALYLIIVSVSALYQTFTRRSL
jgi:hypothetical protein